MSLHPPGHEGRAGMAALALRPPQALDLVRLYTHVSENLPPYARPRFLRLQVTSCSRPNSSFTYLQLLVVLKPHKGTPHRILGEEKGLSSDRHMLLASPPFILCACDREARGQPWVSSSGAPAASYEPGSWSPYRSPVRLDWLASDLQRCFHLHLLPAFFLGWGDRIWVSMLARQVLS